MILIGNKIKELRKKYKFTQTELANKVGVTKSTVAAYENDSRVPSYDVLIKMAHVFNVTIDSLLSDRSANVIDVSGLNRTQIDILESLVSYFRKSELLDALYLEQPTDIIKLSRNHKDALNRANLNDNDRNRNNLHLKIENDDKK